MRDSAQKTRRTTQAGQLGGSPQPSPNTTQAGSVRTTQAGGLRATPPRPTQAPSQASGPRPTQAGAPRTTQAANPRATQAGSARTTQAPGLRPAPAGGPRSTQAGAMRTTQAGMLRRTTPGFLTTGVTQLRPAHPPASQSRALVPAGPRRGPTPPENSRFGQLLDDITLLVAILGVVGALACTTAAVLGWI